MSFVSCFGCLPTIVWAFEAAEFKQQLSKLNFARLTLRFKLSSEIKYFSEEFAEL